MPESEAELRTDGGSLSCPSVKDPYGCELSEGHDGPHRVRYAEMPDKTWSDEEEDYRE